MLFPTFTFAVFLGIVLPVSWLLRRQVVAWKLAMLTASYVFYGWWNVRFLALIIGVTLVNEVLAVAVHRSEDERVRRALTIGAVTFDLGLLGVFKYYDFFARSFNDRFGFDIPMADIVLPVGISFFTFQAISYVIDVRRRDAPPVPLLDFAVYLSFFPQLVAGPIVRAREFMPQLRTRRPPGQVDVGRAAFLIGQGLFKKVVISSFLADAIVDDVFAAPSQYSSGEIVFAVYAYAIQIYADFSGYTDIAIGVALLLGFRFPLNFDRPYSSVSIQDFWRRWHMTLSRWLRDYLYFPLGGNRRGRWMTYRNLFLVMLLGGLWHGAAGTFIFWGAYQGLGMAGERLLSEFRGEGDTPIEASDIRMREVARLHAGTRLEPWRPDPTSPTPFAPIQVRQIWLARIVTFHFVCIGWVFFRASSLDSAFEMLGRVFTAWGAMPAVTPLLVAVIAVSLLVQNVPSIYGQQAVAVFSRLPVTIQAVSMAVWIMVVVQLGPEGISPFIYFQF